MMTTQSPVLMMLIIVDKLIYVSPLQVDGASLLG